MSDQLKNRKASDFDADQGIRGSQTISRSSFQLNKKAKREPSIFLLMLQGVLSTKNREKNADSDNDSNNSDDGFFDEVLTRIACGDIRELNEAIKNDITLDNFWRSIGYSLLNGAAEAGQTNLFRALLKHANKNIIMALNRDHSTLYLACRKGHIEIVELLLKRGTDPNLIFEDWHGEDSETCLHLACREGEPALIKLFLKHGADVNSLGPDKGPPLIDACKYNRIDEVRLLLGKGADPKLTNQEYDPPLNYACGSGNQDIARMLLDHGADINAVGRNGDTPLISAVRHSRPRPALVQFLLDHGADSSIANRVGRTAIDYARKESEIAQMIENAQLVHVLK